MIKINDYKRVLELHDGSTINNVSGKISEFQFSQTDFNISKFSSNTIMHQKTQETSTIDLIKCSLFFKNLNNNNNTNINNCIFENLETIYEELYLRLIKPLYVTFLIAISLLIILKSKSDPSFNVTKFKIYLLGFFFIIFLESSSKFISMNLIQNLYLSVLPFFFSLIIYIFFLITLKTKLA